MRDILREKERKRERKRGGGGEDENNIGKQGVMKVEQKCKDRK